MGYSRCCLSFFLCVLGAFARGISPWHALRQSFETSFHAPTSRPSESSFAPSGLRFLYRITTPWLLARALPEAARVTFAFLRGFACGNRRSGCLPHPIFSCTLSNLVLPSPERRGVYACQPSNRVEVMLIRTSILFSSFKSSAHLQR